MRDPIPGPAAGPVTSRRGRLVVLAALSVSLFLIAIDASVLNVALPVLAADLRPDATELLWIVDSYSLAVAACLVTGAALGDRFGRRRMLRIGLIVFGGALVLAGTAGAPVQLILARVLLGVGGALMMPATLSILRAVFVDDRERAVAVGVWSAVGAAGFVVGPLLGGAVLEVASWPWIFIAQVPLVVLALVLTMRTPESSARGTVRVDPVGAVLSGAGMVGVVWSIKKLGADGLAPGAVGLLAGGVSCLAVFGLLQSRRTRPMIDVRLFRNVRFSSAMVAVLASNVVLAGPLLLLTQYLQLVQGLDPLQAGLRVVPIAVTAVAVAPLTPRLVGRVGINLAVAGAFLTTAAGLALFGQITTGGPGALVLAGSLLIGAGAAVASAAASAALIASAPVERAGNAAAVQETAYELGITLGVSVLGGIALAIYRGELVLPAGVPGAVTVEVGNGLPQAVAAAADQPVVLEAATAAFTTSFASTLAITAVIGVALAVLGAVLLPRDRATPAVDAH
jgi:DHA2 family multidrug resistance protein-like MFS transporter